MIKIIYYTLKKNLRDKLSFSLTLLSPFIALLIISVATGGTFHFNKVDHVDICIVKEQSIKNAPKPQEREFRFFLERDEIKNHINIKEVHSIDEGQALVKDYTASAFIYFLDGDMIPYVNDDFKGSLAKEILDTFNEVNENTLFVNQNIYHYTSLIKNLHKEDFIQNTNIKLTVSHNLYDFYSVTFLVMLIMYGTFYGNSQIAEDNWCNTKTRINLSSMHPFKLYFSKNLGNALTVMLQAIIFIIFTKIVFKCNWGNRPIMILCICFLLTLLALSLGSTLNFLLKDSKKSSRTIMILVPILTAISGGFGSNTNLYSSLSKNLLYLSPNYLAQTTIFNVIYNGSAVSIIKPIVIMIILYLFLCITWICLGRKRINDSIEI